MGRAERPYSSLQRMVTNGDVILVQQSRPGPEPLPESSAPAAEAPEPERRPWPYTPVPPGYAIEFGTGRLVPLSRGGPGNET